VNFHSIERVLFGTNEQKKTARDFFRSKISVPYGSLGAKAFPLKIQSFLTQAPAANYRQPWDALCYRTSEVLQTQCDQNSLIDQS
jgi:hypothetical protein